MVEVLVCSDGRTGGSLIVRKHLDDKARLAHQVRWLTRAQGPGVVRLHDVGSGANHYATHFGGPRTLAAAAAAPRSTVPILGDVWRVLERLHRLGLSHGAISSDHVVVGPGGAPLLLSPGGPEAADRHTDIASFGRMVTVLAEVWSAEAGVDTASIDQWTTVGRRITELGGSAGSTDDNRLVTGAEVRRLLVELHATDRSGPPFARRWLRRRRRYGPSPGRRADRRRSRS